MEIEGRLIVDLFYKRENNFHICKIETEEGSLTVSGNFDLLDKRITYLFTGDYVIHPKYGRQFKCVAVKPQTNNKEGIVSYFSSDLFPGIGISLAKKIYEYYGNDAVRKILEDKTTLLDITSEKKAQIIYDKLVANQVLNDILISLNNLGISNKLGIKICETLGLECINIIKQNPYVLMDIEGIGFKKCDEVALELGIDEFSEYRIQAIIINLLAIQAFQNGDSFLYYEELKTKTLEYLKYQVCDSLVTTQIDLLINQNRIIFDKYCYLKEVYYAEYNLAKKVTSINNVIDDIDDELMNNLINHAEVRMSKDFDDTQKEAIKNAIKYPISIISGGPGVGKTTIINAIILVLEAMYDIDLTKSELMLVAPTGKAARRMMDTLNVKAQTIHRALGYTEDGNFEFDEDNLLPCRFLIIDEASMMDIFIANNLFKALRDDCKIILVGDVNQLPSVNVGNVLSDLINSNLIKTTYLNNIYRQSGDSGIVKLSRMILDGYIDYSVFNESDIRLINIDSLNLLNEIKNQIDYSLDLGYKFKDIVVLAPLYKTNIGINEINRFLQQTYNKSIEYVEYNDTLFKVGDKVIQLKNNSDKKISNGDTGVIRMIHNKSDIKVYVDFDGDLIEYSYEDLKELSLAYCISIHKSQGSEFKVVIAPLYKSYSIMLRKKLFYTCVTRAKELLFIITDNDAMNIAINTLDDLRRSTLLDKLIITDKIFIDGFEFKETKHIGSPYDFME